jgi:hypothetical protein
MSGDVIRVDCLRAELRAAGAPYLVFHDPNGPHGAKQPFLFECWEPSPEPHVWARLYYKTFDDMKFVVDNHVTDWRAAGAKQVLTEDSRFLDFVFPLADNPTENSFAISALRKTRSR